VFPALALLSAVGICTVWPLIWPGAVRPRLRRAACAALIAVLAAGQVYYYFDRHVAVFNEQFRDVKPYRDGEDALFRSVHFPPGTQIFVISDVIFSQVYANNMIWFLSDDLSVQTGSPRQVSLDYLWGLPRNVDYAFFLKPGDTKTLELLQAAFTLDPPAYTTYPIPPDKQFVLYYAPAVKQ
jgi:hypothetical protein